MEQKTIGKFITTLRKANGMTQKELAEKLNVSDKTVSRWERDDGSPDLSTIPVIAEIFGVTCDELLRGERKSAAERTKEPIEEPTAKGEKQRQRLLTMSLSKYRNQSYIAMGISAVGLIAAMICNLGFLRAYIGFFVAAIFYVASIVCQAIFVNGAYLSVSDEAIGEKEAANFKNAVVDLARSAVYITVTLFGATLPLLVFAHDTYMGLEALSWLLTGSIFGGLGLLLCGVVWYFLQVRLLKNGVISMSEKEETAFWRDHKLKRNCAIVLVVLLVITAISQTAVNERWNAWNLAKGTAFTDYDSFVEFMEQDIEPDYYGSNVVPVPDDIVYYDQFGNEIPEEEALRSEVRIYDGTEEGKVVCTYIHRNGSVQDIKTSDTEDGLPIMAITYGDYRSAQQKVSMINGAFAGLYIMECVGAVLLYHKKHMCGRTANK